MAQLRILQPTPWKLGVAYLRWGPLWSRRGLPIDPEVPLRFVRAMEEEYVQKRGLFLRVLPNAFLRTARAEQMETAFGRFTAETPVSDNTYDTFVLDLSPPLDQLRRQMDRKWRNQLTTCEKKNLKVTASTGTQEFRAFLAMYDEMKKRKHFASAVRAEDFERIQALSPEAQRMRVFLCEEAGTAVAGLVASAMGDSAVYLMGATSEQGRKLKGSYLLQWSLIQWLKENGNRWYDLGGIDRENNPGVYHYKKGLSGQGSAPRGPLCCVYRECFRENGECSDRFPASLQHLVKRTTLFSRRLTIPDEKVFAG